MHGHVLAFDLLHSTAVFTTDGEGFNLPAQGADLGMQPKFVRRRSDTIHRIDLQNDFQAVHDYASRPKSILCAPTGWIPAGKASCLSQ